MTDHDPDVLDQPEMEMSEASRRKWLACLLLAGLALLVGLSAPFWEAPLLAALGVRTPDSVAVAGLSLSVTQLTRQLQDARQALQLQSDARLAARGVAEDAARSALNAQERLSMLALIQLSAALRHPGPFETELAMVGAAGGDLGSLSSLLERIRPFAPLGIPGTAQIHRDFASLARRIEGGGMTPIRWAVALMGLSPPVAASDEATAEQFQQAASQLGAGDLSACIATLRAVEGPARDAVADWIEDAAARQAADDVVQRVSALAGQNTRTARAGDAP